MAIRRVLLVVNPAARRAARARVAARNEFTRTGVTCDVFLTEEPGHAARAIPARAHAYDAVFTLGGDGTAMEVIGALAGTGPPVGILPGGTGNVLVRSLGIPLTVRRAVRALLRGDEARIDLGRLADGRRFVIGVGVGIDATMIAETTGVLKERFGLLAYVLVGLRSALKLNRFHARITVDGAVHEFDATSVLVANFGTLLHRLITLGSGIQRDDGVLDVCVFSPRSIWDAARIGWRLMRRDFRPDPCMFYARGREITVATDPARVAQADGEILGTTPLSIVVEPVAGRLLLPATRRGRG